MKITRVFGSLLIVLTSLSTQSQTKQKAAASFVAALNKILKQSPNQHWAYEGKMSVDSAFSIGLNDEISVTVRYKTDTSTFSIRMAAPVKEITSIGFDVYLFMQYPKKYVHVFESTAKKHEFKEVYTLNLFHIGIPPEEHGKELHNELQGLLEELLEYYDKS